MSNNQERIAIVDRHGILQRFASKEQICEYDTVAVELVLVHLPNRREVVLFNRGQAAADMHRHWAMESGKVNREDFGRDAAKNIGKKIPLGIAKNAAVREFSEEFGVEIVHESLQFVEEFYMPKKDMYFVLLSLAIEGAELHKLSPNRQEIADIKCFTLEEFQSDYRLGDAIEFKKERIVDYLEALWRR